MRTNQETDHQDRTNFEDMSHINVTWQRQDDFTYVKMCLSSLVTDMIDWRFLMESSTKLQRKNVVGWYPPPGRPRVTFQEL